MKPVVRIRHLNFFPGFNDAQCLSHILMELAEDFEFVFDGEPDILLMGCYGQQAVGATQAIKVGYYTENLAPDLTNFDYFFGCEYTPLIGHPAYCKRVFGPMAVYPIEGCQDPSTSLSEKTEFANFIYSTRVAHRERFFTYLSRYRAVRAPGKSMNNCQDLAARADADWQSEKIKYLRRFKFTIAFENSSRAGYVTEKLFDAFVADTIPIYWGDPKLDTIVNKDAVIFVDGVWDQDLFPWLHLPEQRVAYRPYLRSPSLFNKLAGRFNDQIAQMRAHWPYSKGFARAIEEIRELDNNDDAYLKKLTQPRVKQYKIQQIRQEYFAFWRKIIRQALAKRIAQPSSHKVLAP